MIDRNKVISQSRQQEVEHSFETMVGCRKNRYCNTPEQKKRTELFEDYYLLYTRKDQKLADLEAKLAEKEKEIETTRKVFADGIVNQFRIIRLRNQRIIDELEDVKNEFCKPHLNGNGQKTFSVNKLEKIINSKIKNLKQQIT